MTIHGPSTCGGAAWCAECNARMIVLEGAALRLAVKVALDGESKTMHPDAQPIVIARVERSWRDSKRFRDRYREQVQDGMVRMTG